MNKRQMSIAGIIFEVSLPYEEGQTINAAEAKALNQTRCENISNTMRKQLQALASEDGTYSAEALQEAANLVTAQDESYVFSLTQSGGARRSVDPLEKECLAVAKAYVTSKIKEAGKAVKDYDKEAFAEKVESIKDHAEIVKVAKRRLADREKVADGVGLEI